MLRVSEAREQIDARIYFDERSGAITEEQAAEWRRLVGLLVDAYQRRTEQQRAVHAEVVLRLGSDLEDARRATEVEREVAREVDRT